MRLQWCSLRTRKCPLLKSPFEGLVIWTSRLKTRSALSGRTASHLPAARARYPVAVSKDMGDDFVLRLNAKCLCNIPSTATVMLCHLAMSYACHAWNLSDTDSNIIRFMSLLCVIVRTSVIKLNNRSISTTHGLRSNRPTAHHKWCGGQWSFIPSWSQVQEVLIRITAHRKAGCGSILSERGVRFSIRNVNLRPKKQETALELPPARSQWKATFPDGPGAVTPCTQAAG